jgi:DNA modification methylase
MTFLESKRPSPSSSGIEPGKLHASLFPFQDAIARWAIKRGRAAIFADCGLGKTRMQLQWAAQVGGPTLIVAPLAVAEQTIAEAAILGQRASYVTAPVCGEEVDVTNYQRLSAFVGAPYRSIVLDESSILKSLDGSTRKLLIDEFSKIPYRLCCTATPAPNDLTELGNHAAFLGVMSFREMSATFFVKESNGQAWRLKGHARDAFSRWLASWSVFIRKPSDLGFSDDGFDLPELLIEDVSVESDIVQAGRLFPGMKPGISGRIEARKQTADDRVLACKNLTAGTEQWIVWCGLNAEADAAENAIDGAVQVSGSMPDDAKMSAVRAWISGEVRVLVTKPSILGFGMNFQHCSRMAFLGLGDSYEQYYQAIRRCWRFGQHEPVRAVIVTSHAEQDVVANVRRKEVQAATAAADVVAAMREHEREAVVGSQRQREDYVTDEATGDGWRMMLGDSVERLSEIDPESVGLSVFSPPFVSLYTYTNTERDMGNSPDEAVFFEQFAYVIKGLLRATMPGRNCCVHVSQVPAMLVRDGFIGMKDFRAATVAAFVAEGWIYHGEVVIDKDPQAQAIRTKSKGLLFIQLKKDSSWLRPALADYILVFRKPGENPAPIIPDLTNDEWISWARPIWYGIRETKTLNYREARTEKDERHICPLQLDVIERCVRLWSAPGDLVCSPFAGIGSEGHVAVMKLRRFVGCELKREYYECAVRNLEAAESQARAGTLFAEEK